MNAVHHAVPAAARQVCSSCTLQTAILNPTHREPNLTSMLPLGAAVLQPNVHHDQLGGPMRPTSSKLIVPTCGLCSSQLPAAAKRAQQMDGIDARQLLQVVCACESQIDKLYCTAKRRTDNGASL